MSDKLLAAGDEGSGLDCRHGDVEAGCCDKGGCGSLSGEGRALAGSSVGLFRSEWKVVFRWRQQQQKTMEDGEERRDKGFKWECAAKSSVMR